MILQEEKEKTRKIPANSKDNKNSQIKTDWACKELHYESYVEDDRHSIPFGKHSVTSFHTAFLSSWFLTL